MKMDEGFDTGPILTQAKVKIFPEDNGEPLTYKLFKQGFFTTKNFFNELCQSIFCPRPSGTAGSCASDRLWVGTPPVASCRSGRRSGPGMVR